MGCSGRLSERERARASERASSGWRVERAGRNGGWEQGERLAEYIYVRTSAKAQSGCTAPVVSRRLRRRGRVQAMSCPRFVASLPSGVPLPPEKLDVQ